MAVDEGEADGADHERCRVRHQYDQLVDDVCWRLLARSSFGRVVFCQDGEPGALPVNSAVADRTIVFRTSADTTFFEFSHGSRVAFEADHTDHIAESGWSVLVRGTLHEVTDTGRDRGTGLAPRPPVGTRHARPLDADRARQRDRPHDQPSPPGSGRIPIAVHAAGLIADGRRVPGAAVTPDA